MRAKGILVLKSREMVVLNSYDGKLWSTLYNDPSVWCQSLGVQMYMPTASRHASSLQSVTSNKRPASQTWESYLDLKKSEWTELMRTFFYNHFIALSWGFSRGTLDACLRRPSPFTGPTSSFLLYSLTKPLPADAVVSSYMWGNWG